jgi:predicted DNA helicase
MLDEARALERKAVRSIIESAQVICATCAGLSGSHLAQDEFDRVLLDEATQAIEPIALIAWLKAPRIILAGDHQQLAPTVLSRAAAEKGLAVSLFERLLKDQGEGVKQMLKEQYRMSEAIMAFPSKEMYGGELRAHPSVATRTLAEVLDASAQVDAPPVLFLDTAGKGFDEQSQEGGESLFNEGEAKWIAARANELLKAGLPPSELAVIAPYRAQVARLRELLPIEALEIDTVDAFQGREKDAVLLSLTRSNTEGQLGFLNDLRRMNVAMTRARRHLFVVGDSATLASHPFYARFVEKTQEDSGYRSGWEWPEPA